MADRGHKLDVFLLPLQTNIMSNRFREDVDKHLRNLSLGLVQNSNDQVFTSHRELYRLGKNVIPIVEQQLLNQPWGEIKSKTQLNLLTGYLSLIHDLDENQAKVTGEKIRSAGCNNVVDVRITSITSFTLKEFDSYSVNGLKIYQSKRLNNTKKIKKLITKWISFVPEDDIKQIERIYIVPQSKEDHSGTYMPILCNVMIEWFLPVSFLNPLSWFFKLQIERTFYHEIGHHFHRHTFGQIPEQEKEADKYAAVLMGKHHHILRFIFKGLRSILGKKKHNN